MDAMAKKSHGAGTPALLALSGVPHTLLQYQHDARSDVGFGREGAAKLGIDPRRVFKTLMAQVDGALVCAVVPASGMLDLKALAAATDGKKAELAAPAVAERATGYVVGGISPLGQKQAHPTVLDGSAMGFDTIVVSGGRRGLSVQLSPSDLVTLTKAKVAPIGR